MTTEPRSLRQIVARAVHNAEWGGGYDEDDREAQELALSQAEAALAALRTALTANPELIEELGWGRLVCKTAGLVSTVNLATMEFGPYEERFDDVLTEGDRPVFAPSTQEKREA